ncbi:hypothetical protein [Prochlorococcus sp. MIT 1341]|uniref:hypothetical protein n=1 Tax=Prochlorococcus sp. MIT 1341 TaxID=3096221 RepID=UPI002A760D04|nr:hypothetical protein [Prochlorococcus sp. MIT 1341]
MRINRSLIFINFVIVVLMLEVGGQFLLALRSRIFLNRRAVNPILVEYLKYVNHSREPKTRFLYPFQKPKNLDKNSIFIASCWGECSTNKNNTKRRLLIQGDSWMELLDRNVINQFKDFFNSGYEIINGGTTSFSPSLMEAQFGYLIQRGNNFEKVVAFVDHTDIADEYYNYRKLLQTSGRFAKVRPIQLIRSRSGIEFILTKLGTRFIPGMMAPTFSEIQDPIRNQNLEVINHFKNRLRSYIQSLVDNNVKDIFLVTHPHYQHYTGEYTVNLKHIVSDVLKDVEKKFANISLIYIDPKAEGVCKKQFCEDYFAPGDLASHPRGESFRFFAKSLINKMNTNLR